MRAPVVLLGHGSPDPRHSEDVGRLAGRLADRLGRGAVPAPVRAAFLEHDRPSLAEAVHEVSVGVADEWADVRVVPLFLSAGYHVRHDLPGQVAAADAGCHRPVGAVAPPLMSEDDAWTLAALRESAEGAGHVVDAGRAAVVATAGSTDPQVLRAWDAAAARWTRDGPWAAVEVAHASGPGRRPEAAVDSLRRLGIDAQVLVPALVARGSFGDRIARHAVDIGVGLGAIVGATESFLDRLVRTSHVALCERA